MEDDLNDSEFADDEFSDDDAFLGEESDDF